jgi:hypothetical protein
MDEKPSSQEGRVFVNGRDVTPLIAEVQLVPAIPALRACEIKESDHAALAALGIAWRDQKIEKGEGNG